MSGSGALGISDPMSFLYLDYLANMLLRDTEALEEEFKIKLDFVHEQEQLYLQNEQELFSIDEIMTALKHCIFRIEMELAENESHLLEAERITKRIETYCNPCDDELSQLSQCKYNELLTLLVSADYSTKKCNQLSEEIAQYNKEAAEHMVPCNAICQIMEYHINTLEHLEKQIDSLQSKAVEVLGNYDKITEEMDIPSLSTKCVFKSVLE